MNMTKARREMFEEQLRALQDDIASLSMKLHVTPSSHSNHRHTPHSQQRASSPARKPNKKEQHESSEENNDGATLRAQLTRLQKELRVSQRERDDAIYQLNILKRDYDEVQQRVTEHGKLRSHCEHLQQENESLRVSLQASERIRKQQKELISILQKAQSALDATNMSYISANSSIASHDTPQPLNFSLNSSAWQDTSSSMPTPDRIGVATPSSANSAKKKSARTKKSTSTSSNAKSGRSMQLASQAVGLRPATAPGASTSTHKKLRSAKPPVHPKRHSHSTNTSSGARERRSFS